MEINDILSQLGLDLSNPEAKRGAMEAIDAIIASRTPITGGDLGGNMGGAETEVELDPDLIQPSVKQAPSGMNDQDIEVEDEENILDQIKHNDSEETEETQNSAGNDSDSDGRSEDDSGSNDESSDTGDSGSKSADTETDTDDTEEDDKNTDYEKSEEEEDDYEESEEDPAEAEDDNEESDADSAEEVDFDDESNSDEENEDNEEDSEEGDSDDIDSDETFDNDESEDESEEDSEETEEDEFDFDDDDLIDDELKNSTEDEEIKTKHDARKIKRERTLAAAKKALSDAQTKKVAPALIRELEKAIEALEALTEAVAKSIKDISDDEFNRLVNRVFDAIDACGGSDLTFTSEEEREARVKEIKDDLAKAETQAELSAEDAAKIRAETQAIKAREKEAAKYAPVGRGSFKGFQDFLNSLYRAIALQVATEEARDDSWSAINRRNSGAGVLRQGQKVNELPNRKIPVIDFYFDQSGSWGPSDIEVGKKAVSALAEMEKNGQIKINLYYFGDHVNTVPEHIGGGTSAWNEIVKNVISTQATNVIIMTDGDMERRWRPNDSAPLKYTVPGYVWYLWKNGENAPRLPRDLKGRGGVQQFSFNAGDI
jgi:hypothetical protein